MERLLKLLRINIVKLASCPWGDIEIAIVFGAAVQIHELL